MTAALGEDFASPKEDRHFEDYVPGRTYSYGMLAVSEEEILEFGRRYDPQPIHTDPDWATAGPFGGLIASGWQTCALMMRLLADHYLPTVTSLGSPGIDALHWLIPLRPGDQIAIRVEITGARRSRSRPDRGIVQSHIEVLNQRGEVVMSFDAANLILARDPA